MAAHNETPERPQPAGSIQELVGDITTIVRQEVELAKTELNQKLKSAGVGAGMLSVSAVTGLFTLACLTALAVALLSLLVQPWIAILVVTVLWGAATATLALIGKKKVKDATPFVPEQTIANVKEDVEWARQRAKRSRT